jgi:hypothetical protein
MGKVVIAVVILIVIAGGVGGYTALNDDDGENAAATVKVAVDTLDGSPDKDKTIVVPKVAVEQAAAALSGDVPDAAPLDSDDADHTGLVDETPPSASRADLADNAEEQKKNRATTEALPTAGASGGVPGCKTAFVRNQSSRRGVRPTVQVLHYTVSPNRRGWSDVNGIVAFFNRSSSQASSHFVIDAEGHCAYIVPIEAKAWTQAGGNPWAVSYEIIATGREPAYLGLAGFAKLRTVMTWVKGRTGIPLRAGRVSGCSPSRSGVVQHAHGGSCWGGHHDIGPFSFAAILTTVTRGVKPLTASQRRACSLLNFHRKRAHQIGKWNPSRAARAAELKRLIPSGRCRSPYR